MNKELFIIYVSILLFIPIPLFLTKSESNFKGSMFQYVLYLIKKHLIVAIIFLPITFPATIEMFICHLLYCLIKKISDTEKKIYGKIIHQEKIVNQEEEEKREKEKENFFYWNYGRNLNGHCITDYSIVWKRKKVIYFDNEHYGQYRLFRNCLNTIYSEPAYFNNMQYTLDTIFNHLDYIYQHDYKNYYNELERHAKFLCNIKDKIDKEKAIFIKEQREKEKVIVDRYKEQYNETFKNLEELWKNM